MAEPHPLEELGLGPGTVIGPYRVEAFLAKGGMGCLVAAVDEKLGRRVAIKLILPRYAAEADFRERFERECRILARIRHANVVTVYFYDSWKGAPYYAMELIEGRSLDAVAASMRAMDWPAAVDWMRQCCLGLEAARGQGIIHRDLKPANILLDRSGLIRIVDFGLAKQGETRSDLTGTHVFVGTPHYVSPEQAKGLKVDWRSDLYSLGATFFHVLSGRTVFDADSAMEVVAAHIHTTPAPLSQAAPGVPRELARIVDRLLSKDPKARLEGEDYLVLARGAEGLLRAAPAAGAGGGAAGQTVAGEKVPDELVRAGTVAQAPAPGGETLAQSRPRPRVEAGESHPSGPGAAGQSGFPRPEPPLLAWLKAPAGEAGASGPEIALVRGLSLSIGSVPDNPIYVLDTPQDRRVHRRHGAFEWGPDGYRLRVGTATDSGSGAGVPVIRLDGGLPLQAGSYELGSGAVLDLHHHALLRLAGTQARGLRVAFESRVPALQADYGGKWYWVLFHAVIEAGRHPEAGIRLESPAAPQEAFGLEMTPAGMVVLPRAEGVRLSGEALTGPRPLPAGGVLTGPGFAFVYRPVLDARALWDD